MTLDLNRPEDQEKVIKVVHAALKQPAPWEKWLYGSLLYRDSELAFWALAVAWQALRFAWYILDGDRGSAQEKLAEVKQAIADFERMRAKR